MASKFSFRIPTTFLDDTPIPAIDLVLARYAVQIESAIPSQSSKALSLPDNAKAVNGIITVNFSDLDFVPVPKLAYSAFVEVLIDGVVSGKSNTITFTE